MAVQEGIEARGLVREFKGDGIDLIGLYMLAVLMNIAFLLWACGVAMRFQSVQAGPIMQTPVFLILFFAPVYVALPRVDSRACGGEPGHPAARSGPQPACRPPDRRRDCLRGGFGLIALFSLWALAGLRHAESTT